VVRKRRAAVIVVAVLASALIALSLPALAAAASQTFTVNGIGDTATRANCESISTADECTLRGAIEAANATADRDTIHFEASPFDGESGLATIVLGAALPTITEPVEIDAGECLSSHFGVEGPCAEVDGSGLTTESDFTVNAGLSSIKGLAVNGGKNGIVLGTGTELFFATNDWFGVKLDNTSGGASVNAGVLIEPGAKNVLVGGETAAERDVFDESPVGVEIRGASENQVQGNFIGLDPNGNFHFGRSLGIGVRIVDSTAPAAAAEFNEIGGARNGGSESEECSGACNAIATEGPLAPAPGIGIAVESATGPTLISGNYLGLKPDGSGPSESRSVEGVLAVPVGAGKPGPAEVTIGGSTPGTEGNLFTEGENGVKAEGAEALEVVGNKFGYTSNGEAIEDGRAQESAISVSSEGLAEGAIIESNSISAEVSAGIKSFFAGSEIVGNDIVGGAPGIFAGAPDGGVGNLILGNTVSKADTTGIVAGNNSNVLSGNTIAEAVRIGLAVEGEGPTEQSESNLVVGNTISEAGQIGIDVGADANHNQIGGDGAGEANTIVKSGLASAPPASKANFGAISIFSRTTGRTEVAASIGSGNFGAFIKLISHGGPELPNGGILPPAFATVLQSTATGTAQPNATVRIFSKTSAEAGELGALLKVVKANAAGDWSATYATVGAGTLVTATQTSTEGATSELTTAAAAGADPSKPDETKGSGSSGSGNQSPPPPPPVAKAPKVKITGGPKKSSTATTAKFKFKAEPVAGAKFECKLDGAKWAPCRSPKTYKKLKVGPHAFRVRATASGRTGAVRVFKFTVKE
jgi:hypothetical protein